MTGSGMIDGATDFKKVQLDKIAKVWKSSEAALNDPAGADRRWDGVWSHICRAAMGAKSAAALNSETLTGFENILVAEVQSLNYTISDLFREIVLLKKLICENIEIKSDVDVREIPHEPISHLLDSIFEHCLARTSLIHELVLEGAVRGYCHVDTTGRITYANPSMNHLLQTEDCRGQHLPKFFGTQQDYVAGALLGLDREKVVFRRMDIVSADNCTVPVAAEFGPIDIDNEKSGGYAIVVDVSVLIEAEYKAYEASELGILKFDLQQRLVYSNKIAKEIFGDINADLTSKSVEKLFPGPGNQAEGKVQLPVRAKGKGIGSTYELILNRLSDGKAIPLRINTMPEYDNLCEMTGTFIMIENILIEKVRQKIQDLIQEHSKAHHLFAAMFEQLATVLDFDFGTVSIYTQNMRLARSIHFQPPPEPMWPTLWFTISDELENWIQGKTGKLWQGSLKDFVEKKGHEEIATDPTVERLVKEGYQSFLCFPIREGKRIAAVVTLFSLSQQSDFFREEHFKILEKMQIDRIVRAGLSYRDRAEYSFLHNLNKKIAAKSSTSEIAQVIVDKLAHFYQWQNVSIFKVNPIQKVFELLAQAQGPLEGYLLPEGYTQSLKEGFLGKALVSGKEVNIGNVKGDNPDSDYYIPSNERTRSELCLPVTILEGPVWLLNLEDARVNAFSDEEVETLKRIILEIEAVLEKAFKNMIFDGIFEVAFDGVIISDARGRILQINPQACELLKLDREKANGRELGDFIPDPDLRDFVINGPKIPPTRVEFLTAEGNRVSTLLSGAILPEEYGRRVICLREIEALMWRRDSEAVASALAEITAQTRTPVSLASSLIRRAGRSLKEGTAHDLIEQAAHQLSRVGVTYDRVALSGNVRAPDNHIELSIDRIIDQAVVEIGAELNKDVRLKIDEKLPSIKGDAYQLNFVIQSILSYLIRNQPLDEQVVISASRDSDGVKIEISGQTGWTGGEDAPDAWVEVAEKARAEVALGENVIDRFVTENHHGKYARNVTPNGYETFQLFIGLAREPQGKM